MRAACADLALISVDGDSEPSQASARPPPGPVRPSARDARQLTALEKSTGWKYATIATNLGPRGLRGRRSRASSQRRRLR